MSTDLIVMLATGWTIFLMVAAAIVLIMFGRRP